MANYSLTQNLTNLTSGNIALTITPDEGYSLPAQADITVTGGTIVSYDSTTGELVVTAGTTAVEITCAQSGGAELISFSIAGTTYQAEDGMTWAQWCDSAYNTDVYVANNNNDSVQVSGTAGFVDYNGSLVSLRDTIVADREYTVAVSGGGSSD